MVEIIENTLHIKTDKATLNIHGMVIKTPLQYEHLASQEAKKLSKKKRYISGENNRFIGNMAELADSARESQRALDYVVASLNGGPWNAKYDYVADDGTLVDVKSPSWYWTNEGYPNLIVDTPYPDVFYALLIPVNNCYTEFWRVGAISGADVVKLGKQEKNYIKVPWQRLVS